MVTTWAPSYPKLQGPSKMCVAKHLRQLLLQMWETHPAHDSYCNPRCDFLAGHAHVNDTQTALHMTKPRTLLCLTFGTKAGANRPVISLQCHVTCVTARSTRHIWLRVWSHAPSPKLKSVPNKQMRLSWHSVSLTLNHTHSKRRPIKRFLTGRENSRVRWQLTWIKHSNLAERHIIRSVHTGDKKHTTTAGATDMTPTRKAWIIQPLTPEEALEAEQVSQLHRLSCTSLTFYF